MGMVLDVDTYIDRAEQIMRDALATIELSSSSQFGPRDLSLYGMLRYHLGWADSDFQPAQFDPGKRVRPLICLLACAASGGDVDRAVPAAAAIELLHNFTLIHDDIQDRSETRRHRPTLWALWGDGQAINAGDALFAVSQITLLRALERGAAVERVTEVMRGFNETALRIVEGQVLDLGYEQRWEISADEYLRMIAGKTAAIVAFSAWSGAYLGGADFEQSWRFRAFGEALGLGFQVQDDVLGIWGETTITGKPAADDIRRRKKSLPIIALAAVSTPEELDTLQAIYAADVVDEGAVDQVLSLLERYDVRGQMRTVVQRYHDEARLLLDAAGTDGDARRSLEALVARLASRDF
jgi:geranylgeranyl diphosphate synthase type I